MTELATRYNPKEAEDKIYDFWQKNYLFSTKANSKKKPFCIVIPPPNVTGILHMGHALNNTLQDIIIRYKKMQGFESLWMPGTDYAGIATQNVVERELAQEGKTREDLGREEFIKRLWQWKDKYGDTIIHQLKKLGCACDWSRLRFTMDDDYSNAVKEVFVHLYKKGLIYRGKYIINWCPRCQTALSDEEAQHKDLKGKLYYIKYPFKDEPSKFVVVATTRPETMLGDTAVAVSPKDKRYKNLIGKTLTLPLMERPIKIIADSTVDPKFGTGAVKVTPAHDPNDFEIGKRHKLEFVNIMQPDAKLNENAGQFMGMDRFEAREAILEELEERNLLEKTTDHDHAVGHCYRCHTIVEPYLSKQWFVKMKPLAKPAIEVVKKGEIKFTPSRWTKVYLNWMDNIQDWCISRQIWWGHRLPVYYCQKCSETGSLNSKFKSQNAKAQDGIIVSKTKPEKCPYCGSTDLVQDEDVLDTWFSSWLWPFAIFGWPFSTQINANQTQINADKSATISVQSAKICVQKEDLNYFYPTSVLITAPEIIFFWVARMIMAGLEFMKEIPFSDVYIHGTVRDAKGLKMSKSLGNAIDPLNIIEEFGTDALRFSLIINSGQDLFLSKEKFEVGRNFANKIWNASRFVLMNLQPKADPPTAEKKKVSEFDLCQIYQKEKLDLPSRWILSRLYTTIDKINKAIDKYSFNEAENLVYEFFWHEFCDWYLEIVKDKISDKNIQILIYKVLEKSIRMLHPFMPFITEEIWQKLAPETGSIMNQSLPHVQKQMIDKKTELQMQVIIDLVSSLRNIRAEWNIPPLEKIDVILKVTDHQAIKLLDENQAIIKNLSRINNFNIVEEIARPKDSASAVVGRVSFFVPLTGLIDIPKEKSRIESQISQNENILKSLNARLKNKQFLSRAPKEVVASEKQKSLEIADKIEKLKKVIKELK
ncbi:MAG: valine--tRNA ligase [Candidatus Omnitrophica bacterium]|nr:valine--tRNA ligase [Candidatus Omnitrophota bacterium]